MCKNKIHGKMLTGLSLICISLVLNGCETANIYTKGVPNLNDYLISSVIDKDGLLIKPGNLYDPQLTQDYFGSNFVHAGVAPIVVSITNNTSKDCMVYFSESKLYVLNIDSKSLIVRKIMEKVEESVSASFVPNLLMGGLMGVSRMNDDIGVTTVKNDKRESAIIHDKLDPKVLIRPNDTVRGLLFFDVIGGGSGPIRRLDKPQLKLIVKKDVDEKSEIIFDIPETTINKR